MTVGITRGDNTAEQLRAEAARCRDGCVARRLLALALVLEGLPRWKAAEMCGMDRQTLRDWVHRYNAQGVGGLRHCPTTGGAAIKLGEAHQAALAAWVEVGPDPKEDKVVRWRRCDLRDKLRARFGVALHERSVGKVVKRLGFSHISVRPRHPKADHDAQQAHNKTSVNSLRKPSPRWRAADRSSCDGRMKPGSASRAV